MFHTTPVAVSRAGTASTPRCVRPGSGGRRRCRVRAGARHRQPSSTVIAHLRLEGDELHAEVNSERRATEVRALVASAIARCRAARTTSARSDEAMADFDPDDVPPPPDWTTPPSARHSAEFIADHERRWLDETIPALGGRTRAKPPSTPSDGKSWSTCSTASRPGARRRRHDDPDRLRKALGL